MVTLRRRLASYALALVLCQIAGVFAAPLSCGAQTRPVLETEHDCCPAGSHPPGQCPRHAASKTEPGACRMECDAPHGAQLLLTTLGVLPAPTMAGRSPSVVLRVAIPPSALETRASFPRTPPPRLS